MESGQIEMDKLKKTLEMKTKEMNKVKKLAKNILEQRTDIERFFLDSLDFVKKQIVTNRFVCLVKFDFFSSSLPIFYFKIRVPKRSEHSVQCQDACCP